MSTEQWIGAGLIAMVFAFFFAASVAMIGWRGTLFCWTFTAVIVAVVSAGSFLLAGGA